MNFVGHRGHPIGCQWNQIDDHFQFGLQKYNSLAIALVYWFTWSCLVMIVVKSFILHAHINNAFCV